MRDLENRKDSSYLIGEARKQEAALTNKGARMGTAMQSALFFGGSAQCDTHIDPSINTKVQPPLNTNTNQKFHPIRFSIA